jgi:hypothetical protein
MSDRKSKFQAIIKNIATDFFKGNPPSLCFFRISKSSAFIALFVFCRNPIFSISLITEFVFLNVQNITSES